jgi:phage protein D
MGLVDFRLEINGRDISNSLDREAVTIKFSDETGTKSDKLDITVADEFKRPKKGSKLKFYLGHKTEQLHFCGVFNILSSKWSKRGIITITATAVDFNQTLKTKKSRAWEKTTVKKIVSKIATESRLKYSCDMDIDIVIISQKDESNLNFLTKLAHDFGCHFSVKNETLIFKNKYINIEKNIIKIDADDCESLEIENSEKTKYGCCICTYRDTKNNIDVQVKVGTSMGDALKIKRTCKNKMIAKKLATTALNNANNSAVFGNLSIDGLHIYAGDSIEIKNTPEDDGIYKADKVEHTLDSEGWTTNISFSN